MRNPYSPGAGSPPPALVGRDAQLDAFDVALQRLSIGRSAKSQLLTVDVASGNLADLVDDLQRAKIAVSIIENGKPVALLIKPDDYDGLVETLEVMSDAELVADIEQARADYAAGRVLDGLEAASALRTGA